MRNQIPSQTLDQTSGHTSGHTPDRTSMSRYMSRYQSLIEIPPRRSAGQKPSRPIARHNAADALDAIGRFVTLTIGTLLEVSQADLLAKSRGKAHCCLCRQIAMYFMHTAFSRTFHEVASFFDRDRTTVSHACNLVEDMRDDPEFDGKLAEIEKIMLAGRKLAAIANAKTVDAERIDNAQ